jgi:hypothetical protein
MSRLHYLAYGSNLHPLRLGKRLRSARPVGTVSLPGYVLEFNKLGGDASGKGNLRHTGNREDIAFAVLYSIDARQKALLDRIEGAGYSVHWWRVQIGRRRYHCFVYLADETAIDEALKPYDWYRDLIWGGAVFHGFPAAYVREIGEQAAIHDTSLPRHQRNLHVLRAMHHRNKRRG